MQNQLEALLYGNPGGSPDLAAANGAPPAVLSGYESVDKMLAALNASVVCAVDLPFAGCLAERPVRADLSCALVGNAGDAAIEALYVYSPSGLDGKQGLLVEKAADLTWAASSEAVPAAIGGRTNHKYAQSVVIVPTGLLKIRTGVEIAAPVGQKPAMATVYDIGPGRGLLRVFQKPGSGAAAGFAPMHRRWQ